MRTLSPTAMLVRAGNMHDEGDALLSPVAMADLYRVLDIIPGNEAAIDAAWDELAGEPVAQTPRRITWTLWATWADNSRSLLDILDWEPGYNGTAQDAWRYAWSVFRATLRRPEALGAASIFYTTEGR